MITLTQAEHWLENTLGDETRARSLVQIMRKKKLLGRRRQQENIFVMNDFANIIMAALYADGPTKFETFYEKLSALKINVIEYDNNDGSLYKTDIEQAPDFHGEWKSAFLIGVDPNVAEPREQLFVSELDSLTFGPNARKFNRHDAIEIEMAGMAMRGSIELCEEGHGISANGWREEGEGNRRIKLYFDNGVEFVSSCRSLRTALFGGSIASLLEADSKS